MVDYEEYWNRTAVGTGTFAGTVTAGTVAGRYSSVTGFGNYGNGATIAPASDFGTGFYLCRSGNGSNMGTGGCLGGFNTA